MPRKQSQSWVFTLNNYTVAEEFYLMFDLDPITYICFGHETGENGTKHLQGYLEINYRIDMNKLKQWRGLERAHLEPRKGTQDEAIKYTKKQDVTDWFECGTLRQVKPGQRRDLDEVRDIALNEGMKAVVPWANYQQIRTAEKYLEYCEPKRSWKPIITWVYGETGLGKSRLAHNLYPDAYTKSDSSKWWNGYDKHEHVIWDDFRDSDIAFNDLLRLLDRYETRVETKGGMRQFLAREIIITCNTHPANLYNNVCSERKEQLLRRIDFIEELTPVQEVGGNTIAPTIDPIGTTGSVF